MLEFGIEESGIKNKERILFQEFYGQRLTIGFCHHIAFNLIDGKQSYPFFALGIVGSNLRI